MNPTPNPNELITAPELAKAMKVHKASVYRWGSQGVIQPVRLGRSVRFHLPTVIAKGSK